MSTKRQRERRRAIAGQRVKAIVAETRIGLPDRKVATRHVLPGVKPGRQVVTASQVVDVKPMPRRVSAPMATLSSPSYSSGSTARPASKPVASKPFGSPAVSFKSPRAKLASSRAAAPLPSLSVRPSKPALPSPSVQASLPSKSPSRTSFVDPTTCKPRPNSSKSKGGGSRSFIPWCS